MCSWSARTRKTDWYLSRGLERDPIHLRHFRKNSLKDIWSGALAATKFNEVPVRISAASSVCTKPTFRGLSRSPWSGIWYVNGAPVPRIRSLMMGTEMILETSVL